MTETRVINANKFGITGPLRDAAEAAASRKCRVRETTSSRTIDGWLAIETTASSGQNNWPGLVFVGEQSPEIEKVLEACC